MVPTQYANIKWGKRAPCKVRVMSEEWRQFLIIEDY
jgi:hypothetical protein